MPAGRVVRGVVEQDVHDPAVSGVAGTDGDGAAVHGGPLPDADQTVPRPSVPGPGPGRAGPVAAGAGDPDATAASLVNATSAAAPVPACLSVFVTP